MAKKNGKTVCPNKVNLKKNEIANDSKSTELFRYFFLFIFMFAFFYLINNNLNVFLNLVKTLLSYFLGREGCSVSVSSKWSNLFVQPTDCDLCSSIKEISQVINITSEEFETRYAYSMEPLVIRGAIQDWKALETFSLEFFKQLYASSSRFYRCQFFPYRTPYTTLNQALKSINDDGNYSTMPWYIGWSNCDPEITRKLRQYYKRPSFLPSDSEDSRLDWIFMGTPGYGAPMHIDNVGYSSWQAQIKGSKKWTLEPSHECFFKCNRLEVTVNSGDIIVLDTNKWFHQTLIIGNEFSITIGSEYD